MLRLILVNKKDFYYVFGFPEALIIGLKTASSFKRVDGAGNGIKTYLSTRHTNI
jgi:hypothetical protein